MHQTIEELDDIIFMLSRISSKLRSIAILLLGLTVLNLMVTLAFFFLKGQDRESQQYRNYTYMDYHPSTHVLIPIAIMMLISLTVVLLAIKFDLLRKHGETYFEELSDELHGTSSDGKAENISIKARVIIRDFLAATSVPLLPGNYGPAAIALVNIMFAILVAFSV